MSDTDTDGQAVVEWLMSTDQSDPTAWLAALLHRPEWHHRAACRGVGTATFFPGRGATTDDARALCASCEVRDECLSVALADSDQSGVWGGTSDRERKRMRRDAMARQPKARMAQSERSTTA